MLAHHSNLSILARQPSVFAILLHVERKRRVQYLSFFMPGVRHEPIINF